MNAINRHPIVDVDSHWTFPWEFELEKGPLKRFSAEIGGSADIMTFFLGADLMHSLPPAERPDAEGFFPQKVMPDGQIRQIPEFWDVIRQVSDAGARVRWMDKVGIDYCLVNPGGYAALYPLLGDLKARQEFLFTCNEALADQLESQSTRLGAISAIDLHDMDWAIAELTRMRARGSRAVVVRTEPVNGFSPGHSHWDRFWSAVVDLGMIATMHIGVAPAAFGDFARIDWENVTLNWRGAFLRMSNSQNHQGPELFLNAMLYGGVFERHPKLTILVSELWTGWVPHLIRKTDAMCRTGVHGDLWGEWPYPLAGGEYLRRNVRVTPLPGLGDWDAMGLLRDFPEMVVFSSDYPHTEGNADPINLYRPALDELPASVRDGFLGLNMVECYARIGDPVV